MLRVVDPVCASVACECQRLLRLRPYPLQPRYLRPSIQRFPSGPQQEALARQAGFAAAVHYPIAFGLMGCLVATKGE